MTVACSYCGVLPENCQPGGQWYDVCPLRLDGGPHDFHDERPRRRAGEVVPPVRHLRKARQRLDRLNALMDPAALARSRREARAAGGPTLQDRRVYAAELAVVLRDYGRVLDGLLPPVTAAEEPEETVG